MGGAQGRRPIAPRGRCRELGVRHRPRRLGRRRHPRWRRLDGCPSIGVRGRRRTATGSCTCLHLHRHGARPRRRRRACDRRRSPWDGGRAAGRGTGFAADGSQIFFRGSGTTRSTPVPAQTCSATATAMTNSSGAPERRFSPARAVTTSPTAATASQRERRRRQRPWALGGRPGGLNKDVAGGGSLTTSTVTYASRTRPLTVTVVARRPEPTTQDGRSRRLSCPFSCR